MARHLLRYDTISGFLEILATFGEVHGPVLSDDGVLTLGPVRNEADLRLNYSRSLIPPKKYLLHPRETVLAFDPHEGYRRPPSDVAEILLIGLHPCDLQGIAYLDKVFLGDNSDPLYGERRNALTLVGLSCKPDYYCFCGNFSADRLHGCDLFMRHSADGFYLVVGTPKGAAILEKLSPLLAEGEPLPAISRSCKLAESIRQVSASGKKFEKSSLWDNFADRCLSCGACSLCCPTCYCFDIREYGSLDGKTAIRLREWDNCLFKSHGEVAGGLNFRKSRRERFQYRFQHKYLGFGPTRGIVSCVGCGRCREVCPVKIDMTELFMEGEIDAQQ